MPAGPTIQTSGVLNGRGSSGDIRRRTITAAVVAIVIGGFNLFARKGTTA